MVELKTPVPCCESESAGVENSTLRRLATALPESAVRAAARIVFQDTSDEDLRLFQKHAFSIGMAPIAELIAIEARRRATVSAR